MSGIAENPTNNPTKHLTKTRQITAGVIVWRRSGRILVCLKKAQRKTGHSEKNVPYERNPRKRSMLAVDKMATSIRVFVD